MFYKYDRYYNTSKKIQKRVHCITKTILVRRHFTAKEHSTITYFNIMHWRRRCCKFFKSLSLSDCFISSKTSRSRSRYFEKGWRSMSATMVGQRRKFQVSNGLKKANITLETISFWQNISISIFNFFSFLYAMKACQRNLINFSRSANVFIRKEKIHLCSSQ